MVSELPITKKEKDKLFLIIDDAVMSCAECVYVRKGASLSKIRYIKKTSFMAERYRYTNGNLVKSIKEKCYDFK